MILSVKSRQHDFCTNIDTRLLVPVSNLLVSTTGMQVQSNKAIVGAAAFAHESGIHQHGVFADPLCYEIMTPESVGLDQNKIILGKHSGRAALDQRLVKLGYGMTKEGLDIFFDRFKVLADKKGEIFDEDLLALLGIESGPRKYRLDYLSVNAGTAGMATATVRVEVNGYLRRTSVVAVGPVDATFRAIRKLTETRDKQLSYNVGSITGGTDALGEVSVRLERALWLVDDDNKPPTVVGKMLVTGRASSTDVIEASALAYIDALNRFETAKVIEELI